MDQTFRRRRRAERAAGPKRGDGLEPILAEIDGLIGLDPVKDEIFRIVDFARVVSLKKERELPVSNLTFHMVFTGPPAPARPPWHAISGNCFMNSNCSARTS